MAVFRELRGVNVKFLFSNPEKAHPCAEPRRLRENPFGALIVGRWKNPEKKKPSKHLCMWVDIKDLISFATFGDDPLRGLVVARGRISRFPIDLRRRPYNTLALPCECVMTSLWRTISGKVFENSN